MDSVGIRALKQNASEVVSAVAQGASVTITDRGRPVAKMTPISKSPLHDVIDSGGARAASRDIRTLPDPLPGPALSAALEEMRDNERY